MHVSDAVSASASGAAYPFQTRGETSTTSATQARSLDLRDDLYLLAQAVYFRDRHLSVPSRDP